MEAYGRYGRAAEAEAEAPCAPTGNSLISTPNSRLLRLCARLSSLRHQTEASQASSQRFAASHI